MAIRHFASGVKDLLSDARLKGLALERLVRIKGTGPSPAEKLSRHKELQTKHSEWFDLSLAGRFDTAIIENTGLGARSVQSKREVPQ